MSASARGDREDGGFSLVEVSIILLVLSVLSLILLPSIGTYLRVARMTRARADMKAVQRAVRQFLEDTGASTFRQRGNGGRATAGTSGTSASPELSKRNLVRMLVGDGDIPDPGGVEPRPWRRAVDGREVDTLTNHLIQNTPGDDPGRRYRTAEDLTAAGGQFAFDGGDGFNARFAWRGPYLASAVTADPWGNRYAVNVEFLDPVSESVGGRDSGHTEDVFVLSAGPDEQIDTPYAEDGAVARNDDLALVIWGDSR